MTGRVLYFDVLNCFACFSVVILHFNGLAHSYSPTADWLQALLFECIFFGAVPIFLMLSGATLVEYEKRYSTKQFFKKRLFRVFIPFLVWSIIALIWKVLTDQLSAPVGPRSLLNMVFNTEIMDVYWFFIPLFSIYLTMPLLGRFLPRAENKTYMWGGVAVAFILQSLLPVVFEAVGVSYNASLNYPLISGYLIFPIIGYMLSKYELKRSTRYCLYLSAVLVTCLRFVYIAHNEGASTSTIWSYTAFPGVLLGAALFVLFKQVDWSRYFHSDRLRGALKSISGCSFGVYLIHMFVFHYFLVFTGLNGGDWEWRVLMPVAAYLLCLSIVYLCKKIPFLRKLFP